MPLMLVSRHLVSFQSLLLLLGFSLCPQSVVFRHLVNFKSLLNDGNCQGYINNYDRTMTQNINSPPLKI